MTSIWMNHAYTGLPRSTAATEAAASLLRDMGHPDPEIHVPAQMRGAASPQRAREAVGQLVGAASERVHLTASTTMAVQAALRSHLNPDDRVVTTDWDHFAIGRPLMRMAEDRGVTVDRIPSRADGSIDPDRVAEALRGARLLTITHACNVTGSVADLSVMGRIARDAGAALLVDAAATIGLVDIDVLRDGVTYLAFGAHKRLRALPGVGALVVGPGVDVLPLVEGATVGFEFHAGLVPAEKAPAVVGTPDWAACAAFAAAAEEGRFPLDALEVAMREQLSALEGWEVLGVVERLGRVPIFALRPERLSVAEAKERLTAAGIHVAAGSCNAPWIHHILGTVEDGVVRISPGAATTVDEIQGLFETLSAMA